MNVVVGLKSADCAFEAVSGTPRVWDGSSGTGFVGCELEVWGKGEEADIVAMPAILAGMCMCGFLNAASVPD